MAALSGILTALLLSGLLRLTALLSGLLVATLLLAGLLLAGLLVALILLRILIGIIHLRPFLVRGQLDGPNYQRLDYKLKTKI